MKHKIQTSFIDDPAAVEKDFLLHQLTPDDLLKSPEPSTELVSSIAQFGILEVIHCCPDERGKFDYPFIGRRRIKAFRYLQSIGYKFAGKEPKDIPIRGLYRKDLERIDTMRLTFASDNFRSPNPVTDAAAVLETAKILSVDLHTPAGRKAIAKYLGTRPGVIAKFAKLTVLPADINEALSNGILSSQAYNAISKLKDSKAITELASEIQRGNKVTEKTVAQKRDLIRGQAHAEAMSVNVTMPDLFAVVAQQVETKNITVTVLDDWLKLLKNRKYAVLRREIEKLKL